MWFLIPTAQLKTSELGTSLAFSFMAQYSLRPFEPFITYMKQLFSVAALAFTMAACNTNPKTTVTTTTTTDTTGLAKFQEWRAQQVRDSIAMANTPAQAAYAPVATKSSSSGTSSTRHSNNYSSGSNNASNNTASTTMNSESSAAAKKRGWSKTAKGAVIGGVAGAGAGAIINKKNRGAGAVIGGVVGAGAGAIIGNEKDKKDGRH
ncbi:MAG: hypothetical protein JWP88_185 [Flaviaesturariibacter sp.]|nr:hypothetical protein [Flaviaesturariibacter sp.]